MNQVFLPINACDGARRTPEGETIGDQSLSVRLTAACDNACNFCIAAEDMKISHNYQHDTVTKKTLESGTESVSIIGGEPLLFLDRLEPYVNSVRDHVKEIYLTTSLPITITNNWDQFIRIMNNIDYLTISIQEIKPLANNLLMNSKKRHNRIDILAEILRVPDMRHKVTVSLNLVKGGVDSEESLKRAIDKLESFGLRHLRINELMHATDSYVSYEDIMGVTMPSPYANGCKTQLLEGNLEIYLKRSCFMVEESLGATVEDVDKLNYKMDNPDEFTQPGWRILYEHGDYDLKWRKSRV